MANRSKTPVSLPNHIPGIVPGSAAAAAHSQQFVVPRADPVDAPIAAFNKLSGADAVAASFSAPGQGVTRVSLATSQDETALSVVKDVVMANFSGNSAITANTFKPGSGILVKRASPYCCAITSEAQAASAPSSFERYAVFGNGGAPASTVPNQQFAAGVDTVLTPMGMVLQGGTMAGAIMEYAYGLTGKQTDPRYVYLDQGTLIFGWTYSGAPATTFQFVVDYFDGENFFPGYTTPPILKTWAGVDVLNKGSTKSVVACDSGKPRPAPRRKRGVGALPPPPVYSLNTNITLPQKGYYCFHIISADDAQPQSYTIHWLSESIQLDVLAHRSVVGFDLNAPSILENVVPASSGLISITSNEVVTGGRAAGVEVKAGSHFLAAMDGILAGTNNDAVELITENPNVTNLDGKTGVYGFNRPTGENALTRVQYHTIQLNTISDVFQPLIPSTPDILMGYTFPLSSLGQATAQITSVTCIEYVTPNKWVPAEKPSVDVLVYQEGMAKLRDVAQFNCNPTHYDSVLRDIRSGIRSTARTIGSFVRGINSAKGSLGSMV